MPPSLQNTTKDNDLSSKRRRFQPPITSFFPATTETDHAGSSSAPHLSYTHYSTTTSSPTPAVDAKIQASLLSVGMRVRKSVAEGYKTRIPYSKDKPTLYTKETPIVGGPTAYPELAPFCGMMNSAESATQPMSHTSSLSYNKMDQLITDDGDAFSLPSSSQESIESVQTTAQKRSYDCAEDDLEDTFDEMPTHAETNWQNFLDMGTGMDPVPGRTILTPSLGQQRRQFVAMKTQTIIDVDDFEEPTFLRRREEVDMDLS
ncbi:ribonucleotide reductase inhibitor-domain-containing protein [Aspergillus pseudonomiae]|uniref:Ribonucleotide reductase inhibitor-domain-containing protein n=1 Tax=Aspergillus pseudonomiae TaxID=1506151 RepID=A0A5N6HRY2_9EURO|nr:ribonucleotide reductase inhibitor-domain-containing protein [Aspergillus pseudonomiae]KAB8257261.1 ribonucleotide reductase inhibitor-domain-containing protein [Aspergillus pseudonomiae]KAE8402748.1 ribonucleotide reductase inhibitor-domain-containing protein [Aspergillus pseudonomiae]